MHAKIENNSIVEYPIINLRQYLPNVSLPEDLSNNANLPDGFVYITSGTPPQFNPNTQKLQQRSQPEKINNKWVLAYDVVDLSQDELDAIATTLRENAKAVRAEAVSQIKVTTTAGNTFDGDEISQARMDRAITILSSGFAPSVNWVLADNRVIDATAAELIEALALAGQAQAAIWII